MRITEEQVRYVANLANLQLSEEELHRMTHDLEGILDVMDNLKGIQTDGVEPMAQVLFDAEETATLRPDEERPERRLSNDAALRSAPQSGAGYFKVPKVIEK
jgi:aspartyl-tRNA(Asn)/glutamyl-tRNA(Gln) amidotransferase subunit C